MATHVYFTAIKIVVSPPSCVHDNTPENTDDATRFNLSLRSTLNKLHKAIKTDRNYKGLESALGSTFTDWKEKLAITVGDDIRWLYVRHCLWLLRGLKDAVGTEMSIFTQEQCKRHATFDPHSAPPLSPDTFSIGQQKDLATLLQFVLCLGVVPNLHRGVGIPVEKRSGFGRVLAGKKPPLPDAEKLKAIVRSLLECLEQGSIGGLILTRHTGDLLAALLQICYSKPANPSVLQNEKSSKTPSDIPTVDADIRHVGVCKDVPSVRSPALDSVVCKVPGNLCTDAGKKKETSETNLGQSDSHAKSPNDDASAVVGQSSERKTINLKDDIRFFQSQLNRLLQKAYQPLIIRELLFLLGGPGLPGTIDTSHGRNAQGSVGSSNPWPSAPHWLRKKCEEILADRLMKPKGIQWVLHGVLDGGGGVADVSSPADWKKCDAVAHLIANCPLHGCTVDKYYQLVCPQIMELLHHKDQRQLGQITRIANSCIVAMTTHHPQLARTYLIGPLLEPLLLTLQDRVEPPSSNHSTPIVLVDERSLSQCIDDIHRVFVSFPESSVHLVDELTPVIHTLFRLLCYAKKGVCHLRSTLEDILQSFFGSCDKSVSLTCLKHIASLKRDPSQASMHDGVWFSAGAGGGAVVMYTHDVGSEENLTSEEVIACTVLELLQKLKIEGLAGDFFICVLKELTSITSSDLSVEKDVNSSSSDPSHTLLDMERTQTSHITHIQHSLHVLTLLSELCQGLGPAVLESTSQMIEFASATLERSAIFLDLHERGGEESLAGAFDSETLSMAFALLNMILRGDLKKKVTAEYRQSLKGLLPSLEKISQKHPAEPLRFTATELRIAIATHGAVWSDCNEETTEQRSEENHTTTTTTTTTTTVDTAVSTTQSTSRVPQKPTTTNSQTKQTNAEPGPTDASSGNQERPHDAKQSAGGKFERAFQELFDPLLPVRGHAIRELGKLLLVKDAKTVEKRDMLVELFKENLNHEDSYIYLSAIQALSCVADVFPDQVIPHLCREFVGSKRVKGHRDAAEVPVRTVETRVKLGEALIRATRSLGETIPQYSNMLLATFLEGVRDSDAVIRASSLSNMADVCKLLRFSLGPNIHEVLNCLASVLRNDPEVEVRQASVLVLTMILRGLGKDALKLLDSAMRDIYRNVRFALNTEKDDIIRLHCQLALEEIDTIMREFIFPKQTLTKKITILP